jgi:hypothetical protein
VLQRLQAEEAAWWGFEQGREEQRELVREHREVLALGLRIADGYEWEHCQDAEQRSFTEKARTLLARTEAQG